VSPSPYQGEGDLFKEEGLAPLLNTPYVTVPEQGEILEENQREAKPLNI